MPSAREALLNAALAALAGRPWSGVRMVDVAVAAGVSRQTLYNEFGSKEGLARALVRREADAYLRGVERILTDRPQGPYRPASDRPAPDRPLPERLASVAEWIVAEAADRPLLRALLTGSWSERLPAPRPARPGAFASGVPAQRRADAGTPAPAELVAATLAHADPRTAPSCELAVRLALSYIVAPGPQAVGQVVRAVLSGRSPTVGDR
ncbi:MULTISPECIES: TetR/AcrR family transcriptional regulator [Streptomyces]|uniref:TetR/AcrR family transcriptional regulator n=1 Tax=Streptomyces solicathayae TaxID=3081768 RepID=A0ABZ0LRN7_9ACTN|nr:TetR/AcrR family transcriptional regulator [Streptomyces sp. HUAS YS2]WOX22158.1 TetR/AcrR family transcriptional regulator [Streptomyces sp. HUAS YS2]